MAEKPGKDPKDGKDAKTDAATPAAAGKPAGSKKKMLIIVAIVTTVLLGGGGTAGWLVLRKKPDADAAEHVKVEPKKIPVFVDLESFTVNLQKDSYDDADRYMQIKLVAEAKDAPAGEVLKALMPAVRNEIILLLGSKRPEEVESREGKEALVKEIMLAANKPLVRTAAENGVEAVNITQLIVQ